jgi:hypothetical protein
MGSLLHTDLQIMKMGSDAHFLCSQGFWMIPLLVFLWVMQWMDPLSMFLTFWDEAFPHKGRPIWSETSPSPSAHKNLEQAISLWSQECGMMSLFVTTGVGGIGSDALLVATWTWCETTHCDQRDFEWDLSLCSQGFWVLLYLSSLAFEWDLSLSSQGFWSETSPCDHRDLEWYTFPCIHRGTSPSSQRFWLRSLLGLIGSLSEIDMDMDNSVTVF